MPSMRRFRHRWPRASQAAEQAPLPDGSTATRHVYSERASAAADSRTQPQETGKSDLPPPRWRYWTPKWLASRASSSWAKASVRAVATSPRPPVYSPSMVPSDSATRRSASAASSDSPVAQR